MNILLIGIGVIGQRHIRNIKSNFKRIKFYTINSKHSKQVYGINKPLVGDVNSKYNLKTINFDDINKKIKIDAAFICLPNYLHSRFLKKLVDQNVHVFLEKPGGVNNRDLKLLKQIQKQNRKNKTQIMLGYHLRFNPVIIKLKKMIKNKIVGNILNVLAENGEHIADYRSYQKYWKVYHAKKNEGGGTSLNQIHEIDYLLYLFEDYDFKLVNTFHDKISDIKVDTEDSISSNFIVSKFKEKFLTTLLLNSYERPKNRSLKIVGSKGKIVADLLKNNIKIYQFKSSNNGIMKNRKILKKNFQYKFKRNNLFINEIKYFIQTLKKNKSIDKKYGLNKSIKALELTLKLKK